MEAFTYVDVFATKGAEYLLVIGFLMTFVLFWRVLNRPAGTALELSPALAATGAMTDWFRLANDAYYHQGHSWATPEADGVVRVGIDDFAQKLLGTVKSLGLPEVGTQVEQGERGWKLGVDSKFIDVLAPMSGEVVAVNEEVLNSPALINQDPYQKGWLMKLRPARIQADLKNLLSGKLAEAWLEETTNLLRGRVSHELGTVLQDGGVPVSGIARDLSPDNWDEIAMDFLMTG
jgi:glycine cleavage system H lipoate-binding protein